MSILVNGLLVSALLLIVSSPRWFFAALEKIVDTESGNTILYMPAQPMNSPITDELLDKNTYALENIRRMRDSATSSWGKSYWMRSEMALLRQYRWRVLEESAGGKDTTPRIY